MNDPKLILSFKNPTSSVQNDLIIEQKKWGVNIGHMTKANFVKFVGRMLYGDPDTVNPGASEGGLYYEQADCGMSDGFIDTAVWVFPGYPKMPYSVDITHGTIDKGNMKIEVIQKHETAKLNMTDTINPKYPVLSIIGAIVKGNLYDKNGAIISMPDLTIEGDQIKLSEKVYGSVFFVYEVLRHEYPVLVPPRDIETVKENRFSSVAYAWFTGGNRHVVMESPNGAEENLEEDVFACGWGSKEKIIARPDDPKHRPIAAYADRKITIRYCDNQVITDNVYSHVDWDEVK